MNTVLLTGANRGIGLELARQCKQRGDRVIAVCRSSSDELDALDVRVETGIDVTDDASVAALAKKLGDTSIDIVINNAGILKRTSLEEGDFASMREQFEINSLGPLRLTRALLPLMKNGGKVAIITSRMGSIEDNTSGGHYGYRMSKAAVNIAGKSLSVDLAPKGIFVAIIHPGMVRTRMTGFSGIEVDESARGVLARIDALGASNTGTFWHQNGEVLPW